MAKFSANVTQTVNPSAPDPNAAARAASSNANIFTAAIKGGSELYGMYKEKTMKDLQAEAEQASIDFLTSNQQAQDAGRMLGPVVEQAKNIAADINNLGGSPFDMEVAESQRKQLEGVMAGAMRLKQAADAGMSPTEYMTRVQALTKRAIAQFPGLANDIRQTVMQSTGLPFADDATAAVKYTREIFGGAGKGGGEGDKNLDAMLRDDAKLIVDEGVTNEAGDKILAGLRARDPYYISMLTKAREAARWKAAAARIDAQKKAVEGQGVVDVRQLQELTLQQAGAATFGQFAVLTQRMTPSFERISKALASPGRLGVSADMKVELEVIKNEFSGAVRRNYTKARQDLINAQAQGRINGTQREEMVKLIDDQEKLMLGNFEGENLLQTATILANHRGKTIEEQARIISTNSQFLSLFGQNAIAQKYWGGDDRDRDEIKKTHPKLAEVLDAALNPTTAAASQFNLLSGRQLNGVGEAIADARDNPNPTPIPRKEDLRPRTEAAEAEAHELWKRYRKDPNATTLTREEVNVLSTMLSNMTAYQTPSKVIRDNFASYQEMFKKLPEKDVEFIKSNVAQQHVAAAQSVLGKLADYDKQGVRLELGVRPSGIIGVVPPMSMLEPIGSGSFMPTPYGGYFAKQYGIKGMQVKPGMEAQLKAYEAAAQEFETKNALRINNMVLSRAIVTGESPKKVGDEYSRAFAARQPIQPFFSSIPVGVSLVEPVKPHAGELYPEDRAKAQAANAQLDKEAPKLAQQGMSPQERLDYVLKLEKNLKDPNIDAEVKTMLRRELRLMTEGAQ